MAASRNPFRRFQLVYRRSSTLVKCVVLAALVLSIMALMVLRHALLETERKTEELRNQAAALEQDNRELSRAISQLGTVQSVTDIAKDVLGLVDPDTIIFQPEAE